jgi:hypothetical protein
MTLEEEKRRLRERYNIPDNVDILTDEEYYLAEAEETSAAEAGVKSGLRSLVPGATGLAAMAAASKGLARLPIPGPVGVGTKIVGTLGSAILGGIAGEMGQTEVEEAIRGEEAVRDSQMRRAAEREVHPVSTVAGEIIGGGIGGGVKPSIGLLKGGSTLTGLADAAKSGLGTRAKMSEAAKYATSQAGFGAGIGGAVEGARQYAEGDFSPAALGTAMVGGALFTEPFAHGRKLLGGGAPPMTDPTPRDLEYGFSTGPDQITPLTDDQAYLARSTLKGDKVATEFTKKTLVEDANERIEKLNDFEEFNEFKESIDAKADELRTTPSKPKKSLESEFNVENKEISDPDIEAALGKKFPEGKKPTPTEQQKKDLRAAAKKEIEARINRYTSDELASSYAKLAAVKRSKSASQFLGDTKVSPEQARDALYKEVESKMPVDLFNTARNLADKRGVTMRIAVNQIVNNAKSRTVGYVGRDSREAIISLDDLVKNTDTPFHETAHVFVRDMIQSSNETDSKLAQGWLTDLLKNDPTFDFKAARKKLEDTGYKFKNDKQFLEEFLVTEGSKKLEQRLRNLPKGTFDKMRRWYSDVKRGNKVKYGKAAVNDILDYMAQRLELDPNRIFDNDLWIQGKINYLEYIGAKPKEKLVDSDGYHSASKVVDGVKYESSVNIYDIPKELEDLLALPERPKNFGKNYVEDLNEFKIALDKNHSYKSTIEYLDGHSIHEGNFDQFMDIMRGRNSGTLKKLYKSLDNKPEIILKTRRPEEPAGYFERDKLVIGIPTIDESFDTTVARYLTYSKLMDDVKVNDQIGSAWVMVAKTGMWTQNYEPYMIHKFLDYAINTSNKIDEGVKAKLRHYYDHLKIEPLRGGYKGQSGDSIAMYDTRMMHQGDGLQGILKNLPEDIKKQFAYRIAPVDGLGMNADEYVTFFDSILDNFGVAGSSTRKGFNHVQRSPEALLQGFLNKKTFDTVDNSKVIYDVIKDEGMSYSEFDRLQALWTAQKVPIDEVLAGGMYKKFVDTAEDSLGVKGLDTILNNDPTPPSPRQTEFDDFTSINRSIVEESGDDSLAKIDSETPIPFDAKPEELPTVDNYESKRYSELPVPNADDIKTWQPLKRFTRVFRPVIDRIRELGTGKSKALSKYIAAKLENVHSEEREIVGKYLEKTMLALSEVHLSPQELSILGRYQTERWHKHLKLIEEIDPKLSEAYNLNTRIRYYDRMIESVYRDTRTMQNDLGLKVAVFRDGQPNYVPGQHTLEYTPEIINQEKRRILMTGKKQSPEYQQLKTELIAYWKKQASGMSDEEFADAVKQSQDKVKDEGGELVEMPSNKMTADDKFEALFENLAYALRANDKEIGSHRFKALRVATGRLGLPAAWIEDNAIQRMTRYVVRFAKDMAMFKHIESDPKSRQILGLPDQEGKYIFKHDLEGMENGGPFNVREVNPNDKTTIETLELKGKPLYSSKEIESVMENYIGYYEDWDLGIRTANRLITSSWLGAGAGIRDFMSSYLFALPYMRTQDLPILATHLLDLRNAWKKSFEYGINKSNLNNLEYKAESVNRLADWANSTADAMLRLGGRNTLEQGTRALQFAFGKQLVWSALHLRPLEKLGMKGDMTADRLIDTIQRQMGEVTIKGKRVNLKDYVGNGNKAPDEVMNKAAAAWVEVNQGTYDARGLPKFTQRGVISMVTSLSRWSIEKADRMMKDVYVPLRTQGDPRPLIKATLGAVIGGEALRYASEVIANKMQGDPHIIEAIHMEDDKELFYALANSIQYAGFFGFQSALVFDLLKGGRFGITQGIPGGFTFPAIDQGFKIANDFTKFFASGEMIGESFGESWMKFIRKTFLDLNQSSRYFANHVLLSEDMSEFNARTAMRKWNRLTTGVDEQGVPSDIGNQYRFPAKQNFRNASNIADARTLLPKAVREAARHAMEEHPNDEAKQQDLFKQKLNDLWRGNWKSTPASPTSRKYTSHKSRIQYLGLQPSKADLAAYPDLATIDRNEKGAALTRKFGSKMMKGTILEKEQAKGLIKTELEYEKLKQQKKALIMRYVGSQGKLL